MGINPYIWESYVLSKTAKQIAVVQGGQNLFIHKPTKKTP